MQDDPIQSRKATEVIEQRFTEEDPGFVSVITMVELAWVLGSFYKQSDEEIAGAIRRLLQIETLVIQDEQEVYTALVALSAGLGAFGDALIGALSQAAGCDVTLTFDKKAKHLGGFEIL